MFKECNWQRLIPLDYDTCLWEKHEAIILNEIVDELDLSELINSYSNLTVWASAYDPTMLLKVLFYSYMNQTFSSRKIARKLSSDLGFMFLAANNYPDFRTVNNFRKDKWYMLEWIFIQIVKKAKELWLISFWNISIDWTKIYANASKNKNYDIEWLNNKIEKLFIEAEVIDKIEDGKYWKENEDNVPENLKTKKGRDERKLEIIEKKKKLEEKKIEVEKEILAKKENWINQTRINSTDKDSRLMKMKRKDRGNWYNPQNATENQFIITTTVPNTANDTNELIPVLDKISNNYNEFPNKVLADAWYWTEKNYKYSEKHNIEAYIPHPKSSWANLNEYKYDKKNDTYEDTNGNIFRFKQYVWKLSWWKRWRPKKWEKNKEAEFKSKLYYTKSKDWKNKYLQISKNIKEIFKRNNDRLYSEEWKNIYKKRSWCVENVFWNMKMNLKFERFSLRWFLWVQIEWNLISLAHNLWKIIKFKTNMA